MKLTKKTWEKKYTLEINILNPKSWRFGSDDLPGFKIGWFLGEPCWFSGVYFLDGFYMLLGVFEDPGFLGTVWYSEYSQ